MTLNDPADAIRLRMAELRRELMSDVRDVGRSARAMTSLSFYVRRFPWATVAGAAALGFMLVPKKKQVIYPDAEALAEMVRKKQVRVDTSKAATESQGLLKTLIVMGLTWAGRASLNYVAHRVATTTFNKSNETTEPAPAPLVKPAKAKR